VPDYFEGEYVDGVVVKATFSVKERRPVLVVRYNAGGEKFFYTSYTWYLASHKQGDKITMIYNPSHPEIASVYAFIGYWITWRQLWYTALIFIILFIAAVVITGKNNTRTREDDRNRKTDY
jgi:hypothetical protein